jgi:thymidylate synthase (FAD)
MEQGGMVNMHSATLDWITPDAEKIIVENARVSSDPDVASGPDEKLLRYCVKHKHWSIFEQANMCVTIETTRDIGRQILRHRSFHFQEFSQRYADVSILGDAVLREARMRHPTNRQMSLECEDEVSAAAWELAQVSVNKICKKNYDLALSLGIAKEVARAILPEGLTPSKMHMNGTVRDWIHFVAVRTDETAQKEVRLVAQSIDNIFRREMPVIWEAVQKNKA